MPNLKYEIVIPKAARKIFNKGGCLRQLLLQLLELEPVGSHQSFLSTLLPYLFFFFGHDDVLLKIAAIFQCPCLCCTGTWTWKGKVVLSSPFWLLGTHACACIFQYIHLLLFFFYVHTLLTFFLFFPYIPCPIKVVSYWITGKSWIWRRAPPLHSILSPRRQNKDIANLCHCPCSNHHTLVHSSFPSFMTVCMDSGLLQILELAFVHDRIPARILEAAQGVLV